MIIITKKKRLVKAPNLVVNILLVFVMFKLVGVTRFERATSASRTLRASQLRHTPDYREKFFVFKK